MLRNATSKAAAAGRSRTSARRLVHQSRRRLPDATTNNSNHRYAIESKRSYAAASDKKRALNNQQIKGGGSKQQEATTAKTPSPAEPSAEGTAGGGGGGKFLALLAVTAGGVGAAYYNGVLDEYLGGDPKAVEKPPTKQTNTKQEKQTPPAAPKKKAVAAKKTDPSTDKADVSLAKVAKEEVALSKKEVEDFDEIIADVLGEATADVEGVREVVAAIAEEEKKMAAAAAEATAAAAAKTVAEAAKAKKAEAAAAASTPAPIAVMSASAVATSSLNESKILAEIEDLKQQLHRQSDAALAEAHTELAKLGSFDIMGLDLDKMTASQLKVRLVQMARDLEERTKWEAVRLQEFLNMKEKEVEDRYVLLIKKLRIEAEQLQEEKLAEQNKILTAQAEEAINEHKTRSDAFLENSIQIQETAHLEDKMAFEKTTKEAMDAKYEELMNLEVTKLKEEFATKMKQRVHQMEELTRKLTELEITLKTSQDFKVGSLEAHKITAAAIALMEKLESGDPAGAAVRALEAVAADNAVVSAAVQSLPASVSLSGVSTLQELQTAFGETIYPQCRKAANVPPGMDGLEGQLLGSIFSYLRFAPGPEEAAPEAEKDSSEYVLARIKRLVQLGELEEAVRESKKLEGLVAFTAKDWNSKASDRVAVEKTLKVIRMECALANENLTQGTAA